MTFKRAAASRILIGPAPGHVAPVHSSSRCKGWRQFLYSRKPLSRAAQPARSDHPSEAPFPGREERGWRVVAAGEGEEGVGPVRGLIVPRPVLPHPQALV